jgi:hypothetical protein
MISIKSIIHITETYIGIGRLGLGFLMDEVKIKEFCRIDFKK